MTRKDYKILADALGEAGSRMDGETWAATRTTITTALARAYANFDAYKFVEAANKTRTQLQEATK